MIQVTDFCKNNVTSITTCYINNYKKEYEIFHISNITHIYIYIYIFFFFQFKKPRYLEFFIYLSY